jgi:hypothetical protein
MFVVSAPTGMVSLQMQRSWLKAVALSNICRVKEEEEDRKKKQFPGC